MTWAVDQPGQRRRGRRAQAVTQSGVRATARPVGAAGVGLLSALVGAWGAISVFVGPEFGYRPTSAAAWDWIMQSWLLHLVPGAVAVAAGLMIMSLTPSRRAGTGAGGGIGMSALLLIAAGAWFVIGPALWPTFESSPAFVVNTSAGTSFINQLGSSLGPGLLLALLGGMAFKAVIARPSVALDEAPTAPVAGATTAIPESYQAPPVTPVATAPQSQWGAGSPVAGDSTSEVAPSEVAQ
jgi:hypothetical protein